MINLYDIDRSGTFGEMINSFIDMENSLTNFKTRNY